jgi:signal transduction histidine kinase
VTRSANHPGNDEPIAGLWAQAAHDLRQPVQAALLLTNILDEVPDRTELRGTTRHIRSALQSFAEMLEILTLLARIEAGLQVVPLRACRIADDLEPVMQELAEIAAKRGILLQVRRLRGLVRSHPKLLVMASRSLVLNAIRHGDGREIEVSCRPCGHHLSLEVRFSGAALDKGSNKHAFVQLSPQGNRQGVGELGLGLPLLNHLCGQLGHGLQHTPLGAERQLLALTLPLLAVPAKACS